MVGVNIDTYFFTPVMLMFLEYNKIYYILISIVLI